MSRRLVSRWLGISPLLVVWVEGGGPFSGGCPSLRCWERTAVSGWFWCGHAQTGRRAGRWAGRRQPPCLRLWLLILEALGCWAGWRQPPGLRSWWADGTKSLEALRGGHRVLGYSPLPSCIGHGCWVPLIPCVLPVWCAVVGAGAMMPCRQLLTLHCSAVCCVSQCTDCCRWLVWVWFVLRMPAACMPAGACVPLLPPPPAAVIRFSLLPPPGIQIVRTSFSPSLLSLPCTVLPCISVAAVCLPVWPLLPANVPGRALLLRFRCCCAWRALFLLLCCVALCRGALCDGCLSA